MCHSRTIIIVKVTDYELMLRIPVSFVVYFYILRRRNILNLFPGHLPLGFNTKVIPKNFQLLGFYK